MEWHIQSKTEAESPGVPLFLALIVQGVSQDNFAKSSSLEGLLVLENRNMYLNRIAAIFCLKNVFSLDIYTWLDLDLGVI